MTFSHARTTKYSRREKYFSNSSDFSDSEDDRCDSRRHPRHRLPPGTEIVVAPKPVPAPAPPAECKYKCCPCHAEKAAKACACPAAAAACCPPPPAKKPEEPPRIVIDVVDRTNGPMAQLHGHKFPISIKPKATIADIIAMLTPDSHRHKVVVLWDDGFVDDLETACKVEDLKYYARKLCIVKRKQVRYA